MADFIRPSPNDLISDGADAISTNADAAADTLGLHAGRLTNLETATGDLAGSISNLNLRTTDVETAINHALPIVASGRPDIPATTPYSSAQLAAMPSGTVYRSTDGPQGAWEWMKRGTAWVVTGYTSGPRNVLSELREEFTADSFTVERAGNLVTVHFVNLTSSVGGTGFVLQPDGLPVGFRPRTDHTFVAISENAAPLRFRARAAGIAAHQTTAGVGYSGSVSYFVEPAPPTALPGTPAA